MRHVKSERLKKFEAELTDLEQWLKLGLVPKKDIEKHQEEIETVKVKIEEERERLEFLKESGEGEEYVAPKRSARPSTYTEMPSLPDVDMGDTHAGGGATQFDLDSESQAGDSSVIADRDDDDDAETVAEDDMEDEESYFSDRNRWKRGGIIDPDADDW